MFPKAPKLFDQHDMVKMIPLGKTILERKSGAQLNFPAGIMAMLMGGIKVRARLNFSAKRQSVGHRPESGAVHQLFQ